MQTLYFVCCLCLLGATRLACVSGFSITSILDIGSVLKKATTCGGSIARYEDLILESHHTAPKQKVLETFTGMSQAQHSIIDSNKNSDKFACHDGSLVDVSKVNDDYCDCRSGEDEPGTSACSGGQYQGVDSPDHDNSEPLERRLFYCMNDGFKEIPIFSSRVNDGVCDCCDGSDEGILVSCRNSCEEVAAAHREATKSLRENFLIGFNLRSEFIEAANANFLEETSMFEKLEASISTSRSSLQTLELEHKQALLLKKDELRVAKLKATSELEKIVMVMNYPSQPHKTTYEIDLLHSLLKVLGIDHAAAEVMVNDWRGNYNQKTDVHDDYDASEYENDNDGDIDNDDNDDDNNEDSEEDELIILDGDQSSQDAAASDVNLHKIFQAEDTAIDFLLHILEKRKSYSQLQCLLAFHKIHGHFVEAEGFVLQHNEASKDPFKCAQAYKEFTNPTDLEHYCSIYDTVMTLVNDVIYSFTNVDDSRLTQERNAVAQQEQMLKDFEAQQEQYDLHRKADALAFLALKNECFSLHHQKYEYKVCFGAGGVTSQRDIENDSQTTLGTFSVISFDNKSGQTELSYTDGTHCWNHGARIAHVLVKCGSSTVLESVAEPSTCLYHLEMQSPAACSELVRELWGLDL